MVAECALQGANCNGSWTSNSCTTPTCYGVPLYRQSLTQNELTNFQTNKLRPSIRMMGQASAQRSTMTLNHASYYIDTTVPMEVQNPNNGGKQVNVFQANQSYDFFFLFATNQTQQIYSMFIGAGLTKAAATEALTAGRVAISDNNFGFTASAGSPWATVTNYDTTTGLLTINIDLSGQSDLDVSNRSAFCQPTTYCAWNSSANTCGCKVGSCANGAACTPGSSPCSDGSTCTPTGCTDNHVCSFATKDLDCPIAGCYGFRITMPGNFAAVPQTSLPPTPDLFTNIDPDYFTKGKVTFVGASDTAAGNCYYSPVPTQPAARPARLNSPRPLAFEPPASAPMSWPNP
jgi:cell migration-inducing and hyaluronan-binding protein